MPGNSVLLIVGSNRANLDLLSQQLRGEGYEIVTATSLEELDEAMSRHRIDVSLVDISGFDVRIWERCEQLRKAKAPFIVISPQRSPTIQRDSMKHGASALLVKPIAVKDLLEFVRTLVE